MELTPFKEIPESFIKKHLTHHQKEYIQIKYYIQMAMDKWEGSKVDLYEILGDEIPLSIHSIRKLAEGLRA